MSFRPAIPFLEYWLNYDYIVNELCENKDKPQIHCDGKCHLNKELAKNNSNSDSQEFKLQNLLGTPALLPISLELPELNMISSYQSNHNFHYQESITKYSASIEIPPRIIG